MNDINQCAKCEMKKFCKKDSFAGDPEEKIPPCFEATKEIQDKAQRDLADEVINWIKYGMGEKTSDTVLKVITLINVAALIFQIIKMISHL